MHQTRTSLKTVLAMRLGRMTAFACGVTVLMAPIPTRSAELPAAFLGNWTKGNGDRMVVSIKVERRSYHEPGYDCQIKAINIRKDLGDTSDAVYVVNMVCSGEDPNDRPRNVREVWALRKINGADVLVMASVAGATFPSIGILQRCSDRAERSNCNL
jgi:hypothetical protein